MKTNEENEKPANRKGIRVSENEGGRRAGREEKGSQSVGSTVSE